MTRSLTPKLIHTDDGREVVTFSDGPQPAFQVDLEGLVRILYPYMRKAARDVERDSRDVG